MVTGISPHRMMTSRDPRTKLPQIPVDTPDLHKTVLKRHEDAKMKQKMYAEQQRNIKPHTLKCGDLVLVKQKKMNKLSTPYDPIPYIVEKVKGSMIVAERSLGKRKSITRNSSEFRKLETDLSRIKAKEPVEIEVPEEIEDEPIQLRTEEPEVEQEPEIEEINTEGVANNNIPIKHVNQRGREIKEPVWMKDYVH